MSGSTAAELARTTVTRAGSVRLLSPATARTVVLDHAVRPDGSLELVVAATDGAVPEVGPADPPVAVVVTDVSPVPSADRVRAEVGLWARLSVPDDRAGRRVLESWARHRVVDGVGTSELLRDVGVLRLTPVAVRLAATCGCFAPVGGQGEPVDLADYLAARPDPLSLVEHEWLGHLVASHAAELSALGRVAADSDRPVVLHAVDRQGMVFRRDPSTGPGCLDVRLDFDRRVECLCAATEAWSRLARRWLAPEDTGHER
jgi:hypothetical protein